MDRGTLPQEPQRQKEETLDVLIHQVEGLSRIKPVLMVVEDVHWTDPTSQELVDALVPRNCRRRTRRRGSTPRM